MARIPPAFIDRLRDSVSIVEVIGARVALTRRGKDFLGLCPFHDEKTPSFSVSPSKNMFYCFGCGAGGNVISFLERYDSLNFVEAVEALAASQGLEVPREGGSKPQRDLGPIYGVLAAASDFYQAELRRSDAAIAYLKGRGLTGRIAQEFALGFAPDGWSKLYVHLTEQRAFSTQRLLEAGLVNRNERGNTYDRFRNRIIFPVRDARGRVIAFGGRAIGEDAGPKYLNSPETPVFHKSEEVYGIYEARQALRRVDAWILVEGYMDVIALAQAGLRNAAAVLGTATGEAHYRKLFSYADDVICCFDGDAAGRRAAEKALVSALPGLTGSRRLKFVFLPEGSDPDSQIRQAGAEAFQGLLREALPAVNYLFSSLAEGMNLDAEDDRAKLANLVQPYIERAPRGSHLQGQMRRRLQELTGATVELATEPPTLAPARRPRASGGLSIEPLARRLLSLLLHLPALADDLAADEVETLADAQEGWYGELVREAAALKDAEREHLLARWSGRPGHDALVQMVARPLAVSGDALREEFRAGVARLVERAERQKALGVADDEQRLRVALASGRRKVAGAGGRGSA